MQSLHTLSIDDFRKYESLLNFICLNGYKMDTLLDKVSRFHENTVVCFVPALQKGEGKTLLTELSLLLVSFKITDSTVLNS